MSDFWVTARVRSEDFRNTAHFPTDMMVADYFTQPLQGEASSKRFLLVDHTYFDFVVVDDKLTHTTEIDAI